MSKERVSSQNTAAEVFPAIDILKFFFAILIMCLHGDLFDGSLYGLYFEKLVVRLAVPFFFIASGFFYGRKIYAKNNLESITKNYISRLAMKLLIFEPISILLNIAQSLFSTNQSVLVILLKAVQNILFYPRGALWYIQSIIVALIILLPFIKKGREDLALIIGLLLYPFALLCNRYYFLCEGTAVEYVVAIYMRLFISARNGIFIGLLYVSMGVFMAKKWDLLKQRETLFFILMPAASLFYILEVVFTNQKPGMDDNALYITHLVLIPTLFLLAGSKKWSGLNNHVNTTLLRNLSTSIYLLHSPVLQIVRLSSEHLLHVSLQPWQVTGIAGIVVACICFSVYQKKWKLLYNWIK